MTSLSSYCPTGLNCYTVHHLPCSLPRWKWFYHNTCLGRYLRTPRIERWWKSSTWRSRYFHVGDQNIYRKQWRITGIVTIVTISTSNSKHFHEVYSHSIFVISLRVTSLIRVAVSDNYSHQSHESIVSWMYQQLIS